VGRSSLKSAEKWPSAPDGVRECPPVSGVTMLEFVETVDWRLWELVRAKGRREESRDPCTLCWCKNCAPGWVRSTLWDFRLELFRGTDGVLAI